MTEKRNTLKLCLTATTGTHLLLRITQYNLNWPQHSMGSPWNPNIRALAFALQTQRNSFDSWPETLVNENIDSEKLFSLLVNLNNCYLQTWYIVFYIYLRIPLNSVKVPCFYHFKLIYSLLTVTSEEVCWGILNVKCLEKEVLQHALFGQMTKVLISKCVSHFWTVYSGAPAARRAAKRSPITI